LIGAAPHHFLPTGEFLNFFAMIGFVWKIPMFFFHTPFLVLCRGWPCSGVTENPLGRGENFQSLEKTTPGGVGP